MNSSSDRTRVSPGSAALLLLALLALVDMMFVAGDLYFNVIHPETMPGLSVSTDRTPPEFFQYTKFVWVLVLLVVLAWKERTWRYLGFVPLFVYLLLDDSLQIHERGGEMLAEHYGIQPTFGLRAVDFGEVLISTAAGLVASVFIVIALLGAHRTVRRFFTDMFLLLGVLVFFGVLLDMIHVLFDGVIGQLIGLVEDGGEMIALSGITAYTFALALGLTPSGLLWRRSEKVEDPELTAGGGRIVGPPAIESTLDPRPESPTPEAATGPSEWGSVARDGSNRERRVSAS